MVDVMLHPTNAVPVAWLNRAIRFWEWHKFCIYHGCIAIIDAILL
jgi:hypothetical protein